MWTILEKKKSQNVQCATGKERSFFRCLTNIECKGSLNNYMKVENAFSILHKNEFFLFNVTLRHKNRHRYILQRWVSRQGTFFFLAAAPLLSLLIFYVLLLYSMRCTSTLACYAWMIFVDRSRLQLVKNGQLFSKDYGKNASYFPRRQSGTIADGMQ